MTTVKIGTTSIIGWVVALLGAVPLVAKLLEEGVSAYHVGGTEKWAAIISVVSLAITQLGRYAQAHAQIKVESK